MVNMLKVSCCFQHELAKKILLENPGSKSESQNFRSRERDIYLNWDKRRKHYVLLLKANIQNRII